MCMKPGITSLRPSVRPYMRKGLPEELTQIERATKNSEKRKEKSRDAARSRRGKECEIFNELAQTLPLPAASVAQLDKASIMRLCIAYLRTRDLINRGLRIFTSDTDQNGQLASTVVRELAPSTDSLLLKALDGFLLVLTREGDVVYASDNVSTFLGISQMEAMGQSVMEYAHPCDHEELRAFVSPKGDVVRHSFIRMKCTISNKARNLNLKSASYKVVQMCGKLVEINAKDTTNSEDKEDVQGGGDSWVVVMGVPIPHPSNIQIPLDKQTFVSKHSLDMKFKYVDSNVEEFCKYKCEDLLCRSIYDMHHALDTEQLRESFKTLIVKGQVETEKYRFLAKGGGYVWIVTQATLISGSKDNKPQYVVCLNYIISEVLEPGLIISEVQLCNTQDITPIESSCAETNFPSVLEEATILEEPPATCLPMPVAATSSLLTEKPKDMDVGFLTFNNNDPNATVLKEEPEDLTHLAPSGGDSCLPLDVPPLLNEELDDLFRFEPIGSFNQVADLFTFENPVPNDAPPKVYTPQTTIKPGSQSGLTEPSNLFPNYLVPEKGILSPYNSPSLRLNTPDPPSPTPLLSQTADFHVGEGNLSPSMVHSSQDLKHSTNNLLFSSFNDLSPPVSSTMDLFANYNMKLEDPTFDGDDFDFRAPYIPPMDDMLVFGSEDLFMSSTSQDPPASNVLPPLESENSLDDIDLEDIDQQRNASIFKKHSPMLRSNSPLQNPKITGSTCVNPNQVLGVHFTVKADFHQESEQLRHLLQEPVARTPLEARRAKRTHSPAPTTPVFKRIRPHPTSAAKTEPRPIFAPVMQHLLVSKEPLKVQGRYVPGSNPGRDKTEHSHSVLRNLLTSGRDEIAGYTVFVSDLSSGSDTHHNSTAVNPNNLKAENDLQLPASLEALASLPVNREGKVELTKEQLSTLLGSAGLRYISMNEQASNPTVSRKKPDPYLLVNQDLDLSSLQELSQLDYGLGQGPSPTLLQDADLFSTLDQTL